MGNGDADAEEPEKKKRLLSAVSSSPMARSTNGPLSPDDKAVSSGTFSRRRVSVFFFTCGLFLPGGIKAISVCLS